MTKLSNQDFFVSPTFPMSGKFAWRPYWDELKKAGYELHCGTEIVDHANYPDDPDASAQNYIIRNGNSLGYDEVCVKGLRYSPETMGIWMPDASKSLYEGRGIEETLPEDGWREQVEDAGLSLLSPKQWYWRDGFDLEPKCDRAEAAVLVESLLTMSQVASSAPDEVKGSAIARRT